MRRIGHTLLWMVVLALAAWAVSGMRGTARALFAGSVPGLDARSLRPIDMIELEATSWVGFALPRRATRIRVLLFAALDDLGDNAIRTVGIEYRVRGGTNAPTQRVYTVVRPGSYQVALRNRNLVEEQQKVAVVRATEVFIDIPAFGATRELELRAVPLGDGVKALLARVAERAERDGDTARLAWQRYSPQARDRVAASSFAPASMLRLDDGARFLSIDYEPLGPLGIEGRDFRSRSVYEARDESQIDETPQAELNLPVVSATRPLTYVAATEVEWDVTVLDAMGRELPFWWQVNSAAAQRFMGQARIKMQPSRAVISTEQIGRVAITEVGTRRVVEPAGSDRMVVQLVSGRSASYKLLPVRGQSLPLRLEFRQRESASKSATAPVVLVKGLDERGGLLWEQSVAVDNRISSADRVSVYRLEALSLPVRWEWPADKLLREVQISTNSDGILVGAFAGLQSAGSAGAAQMQWVPRWTEDIDQRRARRELLVVKTLSVQQ